MSNLRFRSYSCDKVLGCGSYSSVYEIKGANKAIKIFNSFDAYIPIESYILNLNIVGLPKLYEVKYDHHLDTFALVMELADCDLSAYTQSTTLTSTQKQHFIRSIARSLSELHLHGFSHSDIKMSNILVKDDDVYLADFSISTPFNEISEDCVASEDFRPPEICMGLYESTPLTLRTADSWGFGCLCVLIYLNIGKWSNSKVLESYEKFCEYMINGGDVVELIEQHNITLTQVDIDLLKRVQKLHLSFDYDKREWLTFSVGYDFNHKIVNTTLNYSNKDINLVYYQRKISNLALNNGIPQDSISRALHILNKYIDTVGINNYIRFIRNWRSVYFMVCIDIATTMFHTDNTYTHKMYSKMVNTKFNYYKSIYSNIVTTSGGKF